MSEEIEEAKPKAKKVKKKAAKKKVPAKAKAEPKKKGSKDPSKRARSLKVETPKAKVESQNFYGFEEQEWKDLKHIVLMAAFQGKMAKAAEKYKDRQIVALSKRFVLTRSKTHIEKAAQLLCPDESHPWAMLFKTK